MNVIHTASMHRMMRHIVREWGDASEQLVIDYCSIGLDGAVSCSDAAALEAEDYVTHAEQLALACEVLLVHLIRAGCLYPEPWRDYLRKALLVPCEPSSPRYAERAAIKRALKGWRRTTPPWLDQPLRSLRANADWRACIEGIITMLTDEIWAQNPIADRPDYKVGAAFFRQRILKEVKL
jgi:hypothetical protein